MMKVNIGPIRWGLTEVREFLYKKVASTWELKDE